MSGGYTPSPWPMPSPLMAQMGMYGGYPGGGGWGWGGYPQMGGWGWAGYQSPQGWLSSPVNRAMLLQQLIGPYAAQMQAQQQGISLLGALMGGKTPAAPAPASAPAASAPAASAAAVPAPVPAPVYTPPPVSAPAPPPPPVQVQPQAAVPPGTVPIPPSLSQVVAAAQAAAQTPPAPPVVATPASAPAPAQTFQQYLGQTYPGGTFTQVGSTGSLLNTDPSGRQQAGNPALGTEYVAIVPGMNSGKPIYVGGPASLSAPSPFTTAPVLNDRSAGDREDRG